VSVGLNGVTYTKGLKSRKEKSKKKNGKKEGILVGENENKRTGEKKAKLTNPTTKSNTPSAQSHPSAILRPIHHVQSTKSQCGIINDISSMSLLPPILSLTHCASSSYPFCPRYSPEEGSD
jgi:hypothetical protein